MGKVSLWARIKRNGGLYLLLLPSVVILFCFTYIPMYGVIIAFKNYKFNLGILGSPWVGWKYFEQFFNSYQFSNTIVNTLLISLYSIFVTFPLPIVFALIVNQIRANRFRKVFQTITYMPHFISTVVVVGLLILLLSPSSGLVGSIYRLFRAQAPNIMGEGGAFSSIYVLSEVWQHTGWDSIIFIAALSAVDPTLYEAAVIDGASKWQKLRYIDIPALIPTASILLILRMGGIMNVGFEKVYLMQNNLNLLNSEILATYVYKSGLLDNQYSLSSAVNLFNNVINLFFLLAVDRISKSMSHNSLL